MKCKEHPKFQGLKSPRVNCKECWKIYLDKDLESLPEVITTEADITNEIMIPDYIKEFIPKHASVIAIAYKNETGAFRLQQCLTTYAGPQDVKALLDRMRTAVKDIGGKVLATSICRLKEE